MKPSNERRPNTGADDSLLRPKVILCCGEDWDELLAALERVTGEKPSLEHKYRCYRISLFAQFSLIWSGMGTGCLEPLLYELHESSIIKEIVLIGTAGATSTHKVNLGDVHFVREAFLGGTAIDPKDRLKPFRPQFSEKLITEAKLTGVRGASTDYYYGFSTNEGSKILRDEDATLKEAVTDLFDKVDLVDMETAQFYYFCQTLFAPNSLNYVSVKGAANSIADQSVQIAYTPKVLRKALRASFALLQLKALPTVAGGSSAALTSNEGASLTKLMEEVKLFWTIQIAVCGVLGYLGTHLTLDAPKDASHDALNALYLKNLSVSIVSLFLIQIGAIYNLIGNYYARVAALGTRLAAGQENRITPTLAGFYFLISGFVSAVSVKTGMIGLSKTGVVPWRWVIGAACIGGLVNCLVCGSIIYRPLSKGSPGYRSYARPVRNVYVFAAILALLFGLVGWLFAGADNSPQGTLQEAPEFIGVPF